MNNFFKKIINLIKEELFIRFLISCIILDIGGKLLADYGFKLIYSKFSIINLLLTILGIILIIIFFIMLYKDIYLSIKDDE